MNFYVATSTGNYGEFVKVICANSLREAKNLSGYYTTKVQPDGTSKRVYYGECKLLIPSTTPSILFDGGGDVG